MNVLVTGVSKGLGLALASSLLHDGHIVRGIARSNTHELLLLQEEHGGRLQLVQGDVTNDEDLQAFMDPARHFTALVNNAGIPNDALFATQGIDPIRNVVDVNLSAALHASKLFVRAHLRTKGDRSIVNISSVVGISGASGLVAYSATKAALLGATRSLAREVGRIGIRVNAVLPGFFHSDITEGLIDERLDQIRRRIPLGRLGETDDVVPMVRFLLADTGQWITGQGFVVDGGYSA